MTEPVRSPLASKNATGTAALDSSAPTLTWTGSRLRNVLSVDGISQGALAVELGVQRPQVVKWLAGVRAIPVVHQQRLPAALERLRMLQQWPAPPAPDVLTGVQLQGARRYLAWTPRELAVLARATGLAVSRQSVGYWEHGHRPIPGRQQGRLRQLLADAVRQLPLEQVLAREDLAAASISQADLARASGISKPHLNGLVRGHKAMTLDSAVAIGQALDQVAADAETQLRAHVERLVGLVEAHEPAGVPWSVAQRELSHGRIQGQTHAYDLDERALQIAVGELRVHRRQTTVIDRAGAQRTSDRWHLGSHPGEPLQEWLHEDLLRRRRAAGVSQLELARAIGRTWGTVSKWELGTRRIPPSYLPVIETALAALAAERAACPDPVEVGVERILQTVQERPGRTRQQMFLSVGLDYRNHHAVAALARLLEEQGVHVWPTRNAGGRGWHEGLHPGPAPGEQPQPLPGSELRARRQARGHRQRDLAAALGVQQSLVSLWERTQVPAARVQEILGVVQELPAPQPKLAGTELRRLRLSLDLRQQDLAARLGTTQSAVSSWERGAVPAKRAVEVQQALRP